MYQHVQLLHTANIPRTCVKAFVYNCIQQALQELLLRPVTMYKHSHLQHKTNTSRRSGEAFNNVQTQSGTENGAIRLQAILTDICFIICLLFFFKSYAILQLFNLFPIDLHSFKGMQNQCFCVPRVNMTKALSLYDIYTFIT